MEDPLENLTFLDLSRNELDHVPEVMISLSLRPLTQLTLITMMTPINVPSWRSMLLPPIALLAASRPIGCVLRTNVEHTNITGLAGCCCCVI